MLRHASRRAASGVLLTLLAACAHSAPSRHPLWVIEGKHNSVYLLGSVHVLRASDYPLAQPIMDAYQDAEVIYMEIDLDDVDQSEALQFTLANGSLPDEQTLRDVLGLADFAAADMRARELGVDLGMFARFEPWVAALAVVQAQLAHLGLDPEQGVEQYLLRLNQQDRKEVRGLETLADQLGVLDGLALDRQGKFLLMSLEDAADMPRQVDDMITAWRNGDSDRLAETLSDEFEGFPDLYTPLIVARNRNWAAQIAELFDDQDDYLVVVGALHLVGKDSVLQLLQQRGLRITQR